MSCKACTMCGELKVLEAFYADKSAKDSRRSSCKSCSSVQSASYYKANHKKLRGKYIKGGSDKGRLAKAAYYKANREKIRVLENAYRKANRDKSKACDSAKRETLKRSYVASILRITVADLTPELLALKRAHIETYRLSQQVNKYLKEIKP